MKRQALVLIGLTSVVSFLLGLVAAGSLPSGTGGAFAARRPAGDPPPLAVSVGPVVAGPGMGTDFAGVVARLNAAVVNVDAASRGSEDRAASRSWPGEDPTAPHEGSGSGFIIDPSGFILTNNHVVEGADRVAVTLGDGRVFRAAVVGVDPAIDVALLQISAPDRLPVAPLGDSDALRVGEWVCAIGNPLGYAHSVTVGVVSFIGRKIFDRSLDAFIQTDAAISFGNSGGPLINSRGQVVGITTAINVQASNIGFAIPIGQAVAVLPQLKDRGRVSRGFIGVGLTDVTPELRRALNVDPEHGALVQDVSPDSPAEQAGLRAYDVVIAADGEVIRSDEALIRHIAARQPGTIAHLEVWRDGAAHTVAVKLRERPLAQSVQSQSGLDAVRHAAGPDVGPLGLTVKDLDEGVRRRYHIPGAVGGVLVVSVDLAGPARLAGIQNGQVLLEINRRRVTSIADYRSLLSSLRPGDTAAVMFYDPRSNERAIHSVRIDPQS